MKHEYDDHQIAKAGRAGLNATNKPVHANPDFLRAFLDALPEPATDEWQECGFNDFRPTDKRVKAVFIGGSIIEGTPDRRNSEHVFLVDGPVIHSYDDATFYHIPAPVQHPDPAEHPVIIVRESTYSGVYQPELKMVWFMGSYVGDGYDLQPKSITDWEPADIVPKVVEDDR